MKMFSRISGLLPNKKNKKTQGGSFFFRSMIKDKKTNKSKSSKIKIFLRKFLKILFRILLLLLLLGLICYIVLLFFARDIETFFAFPGRDVNLKEITNHPAGLIVWEEIVLTAPSGNTIQGIYIDNGAEKTVYYFHGNGAPMEYFYTEMRYIADLGYNVISYDFPGYGKSTGKPTQDEVRNFSDTFYEHMKRTYDIKDEDVIVWWYSIGTAVAVDFAKEKDFDSLVLFSPLSSLYEMSEKLFSMPLQKLFFLPNNFVSRESIALIDEPTLIIHGNTDKVVPIEQGREVYINSGAEEKYFIEIDDLGHSLITERYGEVLTPYLNEFFREEEVWDEMISEVWENPIEATKKQEKEVLHSEKIFLDRKTATELLKKYQKQERIQKLDIIRDSSLTKYVDPNVSFEEPAYIPNDMRDLSDTFIIDSKWDAQMRSEAAGYFEALAEAFYEEFNEKVVVVSSYRSYSYQAGIKARGCPDNLCAKAGHSEHQSGLSIDLWSASSKQYWDSDTRLQGFYVWLSENAHFYGFHNSYQKGRDIDGYEIEPWHWRYLWVEFADYLHDNDMTFAEYYKERMN